MRLRRRRRRRGGNSRPREKEESIVTGNGKNCQNRESWTAGLDKAFKNRSLQVCVVTSHLPKPLGTLLALALRAFSVKTKFFFSACSIELKIY